MTRFKSALLKSIPVFMITIATLVMSFNGFSGMIAKETEKCWDYLSVATRTMVEKIQLRFDANLHLLEHMADAVSLQVDMQQEKEIRRYLEIIREDTFNFFDRIDIMLPDGTLMLQSGEVLPSEGEAMFQRLLARGEHVSNRIRDIITGEPVIFGCVPILEQGEAVGLLIGMIECRSLPQYFPTYSYDGNANLFLIDRTNGDYLMDNWHAELGNMVDQGDREVLAGYEQEDFQQAVLAGKEGRVAFRSNTNGNSNYMYYMPVPGYDWTAAMMIQDDDVFHDVYELRGTLKMMSAVEIILLAVYLGWNLFMSFRLSAHEQKARSLEVERIANETKSSILSTMSHDLRTPLNGIVGMLEVIQRHGDDPVLVKDCLRKIGVSAQYLMTLTNDVLDINEIENGKFRLSNEGIDLRILASDLDVLVKSKADEAGVRCHVDASGLQHPNVLGSEVHLRRVLVNLITNAIKYNKQGGEVWVTLTEKEAKADNATYCFTVRDTGIGMTKEFQQMMFNSFTQENASARSSHTGHGLGLTIVRKLVEKMGGEICVESEKNCGSTFTVTLPMAIDREKRLEHHKEDRPADLTLTGVRILLVEDNELNMEIAKILLTDAGAMITTATNGREAVEAFAAATPGSIDVILMDVMMPDMDGLEATRVIRKMTRTDAQSVPIIAMTASTFAEDVRRCREAGMNEHVGKPLNMDEMIVKISRRVNR